MRTYLVPTHLRVPETILTIGGVNLSVRQFLFLLLGSAIGYDLWLHEAMLAHSLGGQLLRFALALLPFCLSCMLAFVRIAGRDLPIWLLIIARFGNRPRRLVWRSIRFQEPRVLLLDEAREEQDA